MTSIRAVGIDSKGEAEISDSEAMCSMKARSGIANHVWKRKQLPAVELILTVFPVQP
jgi:hypothetical protein